MKWCKSWLWSSFHLLEFIRLGMKYTLSSRKISRVAQKHEKDSMTIWWSVLTLTSLNRAKSTFSFRLPSWICNMVDISEARTAIKMSIDDIYILLQKNCTKSFYVAIWRENIKASQHLCHKCRNSINGT